jgi:FkbM family methyltransferase
VSFLNNLIRNSKRALTGGANQRTMLRRKAIYRLIATQSTLVGVKTDYGHFVLDADDRGVAETLYSFRGNDDNGVLTEAVKTARAYNKLGTDLSDVCFVDVGANIGTTTVPAITSIGFGAAVAFEPAPQNLRILRANLALNDLTEKVTTIQGAVGAKDSTMTLWLGDENHGDHRLWHRNDLHLQTMSQSVEVKVGTLDGLLHGRRNIGLIWIDTQGFEGFVLAGGPIIRKSGVAFVTEFWPDGMKASNSWDSFASIVSQAAFMKDLRTGEEIHRPDISILDRLSKTYAGINVYTDLLMWFS